MSGQRKNPARHGKELLASLRRAQGTRTSPRRHLIVCEDDKSAPAYFKALMRHLDNPSAAVQVVGSKGKSSPAQVVQAAIDRKKAAASQSSTEPFDKVWCVIDGEYGNLIEKVRPIALQEKIELIISTPCFEYWVLLHFEDSAKLAPKCSDAVAMLKQRSPGYRKGTFRFESIVNQAVIASTRAEKHRRGTAASTLPENQNPCSEIYRLVDELNQSP